MVAPAAKGVSRQDDELTILLTKLYTIQEDIGAKPKTSAEEKKDKAAAATMGKGKKAEKKGSRFLELKSTIVDRLRTIHQLLKDTKEKEQAGFGGDNAKDIIKMQAEVREQIRQGTDEWKEMDSIYKNEARKKKSKFTLEELEVQSELVKRLAAELEKTKAAQMRGYAKNRDAGVAVSLNTKALYADSGRCACSICIYVCFVCEFLTLQHSPYLFFRHSHQVRRLQECLMGRHGWWSRPIRRSAPANAAAGRTGC
jgi:hypothetical protein